MNRKLFYNIMEFRIENSISIRRISKVALFKIKSFAIISDSPYDQTLLK